MTQWDQFGKEESQPLAWQLLLDLISIWKCMYCQMKMDTCQSAMNCEKWEKCGLVIGVVDQLANNNQKEYPKSLAYREW